jgi:hypothetical protein
MPTFELTWLLQRGAYPAEKNSGISRFFPESRPARAHPVMVT